MTDDNGSTSRSKLPVGGIVVLAIVGAAVLFFTAGDASWNPFAGPTSTAQAMELSGRWLGMRLTASSAPTAQAMGVAPGTEGVVVAELVLPDATRAQQAGLTAGDLLVGVDGTGVTNLTDLYTLSTTLDVNRPLAVSVVRQGQPLNLILPGPPGSMPAVPTAGMPGMPPGVMPGVASTQATAPFMGATPITAPATTPPANGPMYFCPNDGLYWNQAQVGPNLTCPRCGGHLAQ